MVNQITHAVTAVAVIAGVTVCVCLGQLDVAAAIPIWLTAIGTETAVTAQEIAKKG